MRCGTGEAAVHHPLLFAHPRTPARFGVCLGKTSGLVRDRGTAQESELGLTLSLTLTLTLTLTAQESELGHG